MTWVIGIAAVVVIGVGWVAARGRLGAMPPLANDRPVLELHPEDLTAEDLRGVHLSATLRGYSMEQVDELLDRLADQLERPEQSARPDAADRPAPVGDALAGPDSGEQSDSGERRDSGKADSGEQPDAPEQFDSSGRTDGAKSGSLPNPALAGHAVGETLGAGPADSGAEISTQATTAAAPED